MRTTTIKPNTTNAAVNGRHSASQSALPRTFWRAPVAAAVFGLLAAIASPEALAMALGRVSVQSSIGEPLRAEIDVPEITADEAASLRANVAAPEAFKSAGLDYNNAVNDLKITLQRRPDGRAFLRLVGDKTVNDPFIDLILEANWASGRLVRDYTLLFDPPSTKAPAPAAVTAPGLPPPSAPASAASAPAAVPAAAPAPPATTNTSPTAPVQASSMPARKAPSPAPAAKKPAVTKPIDGKVSVKTGDTAGAIARNALQSGVSLDQMLLAMLQANPTAFIAGDINRVKSGALLTIPTQAQASSTPTAQAKQMLYTQSKDFNEFRRKLAQNAPAASQAPAERSASGSVQAKVDDKKQAAATPDKLTLSKGGIQGKAADKAGEKSGAKEDAIAKDKSAKDASARTAELAKNISDLSKLSAGTSTANQTAAAASPPASASKPNATIAVAKPEAMAAPSTPVASSPAKASSAASPAVAAASAPATAASAAVAALTASIAASATTSLASPSNTTSTATSVSVAPAIPASAAPAAKVVAKAPPPPPPPEPSFVEELMDNPLVLPAAGGLVAALGGFAFWRSRQRKKNVQVDSSFLESRLQPDSFFGASGGQRVDTAEAGSSVTGSSMVYSPSQLDAAGDVDPVAEADVYLAYGRDLQAEEILKEAMRTNPTRVAVHYKLLEIYAKRRDAKAFEVVAVDAYSLSGGHGEQWLQSASLGRDLDPTNPLYQPGGQPAPLSSTAPPVSASFGASTMPQAAIPEYASPNAPDVDLDLDFSMSEDPATMGTSPVHILATQAFSAQPEPEPTVDFPFEPAPTAPAALTTSAPAAVDFSSNDLSFSLDDLDFKAPASPAPAPMASTNALEFDLGSLSLDLPPLSAKAAPSTAPTALAHPDEIGELETKLALAEEFSAIGDVDGARSLAQEVVDLGSGALKVKAQKFLSALA